MVPERAAAKSFQKSSAGLTSQRIQGVVLVIEDDPQVAHVTRFILHRSGFHVLVATSAEEGLDLALAVLPSVILCDAALPRINGCQLLQTLKQTPRTAAIPVIMMSGHEGLDCDGIFTFLRKPFDATTLVSATRNALELHLQAA